MSQELPLRSNVPDFSVSELAFSLKRTLEENYGRVRVRGEISRISIPKSGHLYTSLKDDQSVIDAICWKGVLSKLSIKPEEGLEVICTGKITTYPARSNYQLIIESMELAGEGAPLKILEERKKKLAAEGLFAPERKKVIPFLPERIGVVTSPTGAVIRDILHRLSDRFPRHVTIWPVKVQGDGAAQEIENAINGFSRLPEDQRPHTLIVARGGGSLEDLMPFNEEGVVRAAAQCPIPIISAIGHETDTTLIDHVADLRAPTPTGAAEKAVPVRINLIAQVADNEQRLLKSVSRLLTEKKHKLDAASARLGDPQKLLELKTQHLDRISDQLNHTIEKITADKKHHITVQGSRLTHPAQLIESKRSKLENIKTRSDSAFAQFLMKKSNTLTQKSRLLIPPHTQMNNAQHTLNRYSEKLKDFTTRTADKKQISLQNACDKLELLSFENVLKRGYVVVRDQNNAPVTTADNLSNGADIQLQFHNNKRVDATIVKNRNKADRPTKTKPGQGSLFE